MRMLAGGWRGSGARDPDPAACVDTLRAWAWSAAASNPVSGVGTWPDEILTPRVRLSQDDKDALDHVAVRLGPPDPDTDLTLRRFIHRSVHEQLVAEYVAWHLAAPEAARELLEPPLVRPGLGACSARCSGPAPWTRPGAERADTPHRRRRSVPGRRYRRRQVRGNPSVPGARRSRISGRCMVGRGRSHDRQRRHGRHHVTAAGRDRTRRRRLACLGQPDPAGAAADADGAGRQPLPCGSANHGHRPFRGQSRRQVRSAACIAHPALGRNARLESCADRGNARPAASFRR